MGSERVNQSIYIESPLEQVWDLLGDFGGMDSWFPTAQKCSCDGDHIGAIRRMTLPDGSELRERLLEREPGFSYTYEYVDGALPLKSARCRLAVQKEATGTRVTWTSHFEPFADEQSDLKAFVVQVYRGGLESARALLESEAT